MRRIECGRVRDAHELSRALVEPLEGRCLLSAYAPSTIGYFGANDTGTVPQSALVADAAGDLFGTTSQGGAYGAGTVFEIPAGTSNIIPLASFSDASGVSPSALTLDSAGNLYGTTEYRGPGNYGTVFEVSKGSSSVMTLASFNGTNGAYPSGSLTVDASGNLYGATFGAALNAANYNGTVFEIATGNTKIIRLASFYPANGQSPLGGITVDSAGNLYDTASQDGPGTEGTAFKLTPAIPGDANLDGKVDFADLVLLAQNYGKTNATWSDGDFNGDGTVGFDDLVILAASYGQALPTLSAAAAPASPGDLHKSISPPLRHRRS